MLLILIPVIEIPLFQWVKRTFCEPNTDFIGVWMLQSGIAIMMLFICILFWISAITNKDTKDMIN